MLGFGTDITYNGHSVRYKWGLRNVGCYEERQVRNVYDTPPAKPGSERHRGREMKSWQYYFTEKKKKRQVFRK